MSDVIGVWVGALLTLFVFSYLLRDTPLFRLAQAILVGVAVGYATAVAIRYVLMPKLLVPLLSDPEESWHLLIPLVLGLLLLAKLRPAWSPVGNLSIGFLFGVGSALAIGGALAGILVPQLRATIISFSPSDDLFTIANNLLLVIGTLGAFLSFRFIAPAQPRPVVRGLDALARGWGLIGRWFILFAFGAIFADTAVARISVLINRVYFLLHNWLQVVP
jgi:hypothetical protein